MISSSQATRSAAPQLVNAAHRRPWNGCTGARYLWTEQASFEFLFCPLPTHCLSGSFLLESAFSAFSSKFIRCHEGTLGNHFYVPVWSRHLHTGLPNDVGSSGFSNMPVVSRLAPLQIHDAHGHSCPFWQLLCLCTQSLDAAVCFLLFLDPFTSRVNFKFSLSFVLKWWIAFFKFYLLISNSFEVSLKDKTFLRLGGQLWGFGKELGGHSCHWRVIRQ